MKSSQIEEHKTQVHVSIDGAVAQLSTALHQNKKLSNTDKILNEEEIKLLHEALGILQSHPLEFEYKKPYG